MPNPRPHFRLPYVRAIVPAALLAAMLLPPCALGLVWVTSDNGAEPWAAFLLLAGCLGVLLALIASGLLVAGNFQRAQARRFWESGRPLVRWVYSADEWDAVRSARWAEERDDWLLQWAGMTAVFGLVGLLVGLMVGAEQGSALPGTLLGLMAGAAAGALLGAATAGANHLAALCESKSAHPSGVALGKGEIYDGAEYFAAGKRRYVESAAWDAKDPTRLLVKVYAPRPRGDPWQECSIPVPSRMRTEVEAVRPVLPWHPDPAC